MPTPRSEGDLVIDKLVYAAPGIDVPIIKGVSFSLSPGEVLGIVGPSAAGKSTLARLLVGILKPTAGGVFLDGNNVYLWERSSFGQVAGYLPQSVSLLEGTIRENIARMAESDPYKVLEAARLAEVHDMTFWRRAFGRLRAKRSFCLPALCCPAAAAGTANSLPPTRRRAGWFLPPSPTRTIPSDGPAPGRTRSPNIRLLAVMPAIR